MSIVVVTSDYSKTGKTVGGKYTNYISKKEYADKSINTKKTGPYTQYISERPRVVKVGEHGLFGQEDYIDLKSASRDIYHHKGIVWRPIISMRQEDAERLGFDNPEAWRNLLRSKEFEMAEDFRIPSENLRWYAAFHKEPGHFHIHLILFNKEPGGEFLSARGYNHFKESLIKTICRDEMKQLYDERQSLRDKIICEVKEKLDEFQVDIGEANDEFVHAFNELKFSMDGYSGKRNYQFISREQKEKVDAVVKVVCKDENLQNLYEQWCQLQLTLQRYYRKDPVKSFDVLEKNKNFERRLQNAVLKTALKDNKQENVYTNKAEASPLYSDIIFSLCKMFEQPMKEEFEEGFSKSIVDSKDKIKEYRRDHGMGMHM